MQFNIYLVVFVAFCCNAAMSSLVCHRCAISAQQMDVSLEQCSASNDVGKCLANFDRCFQRFAVKKHKTTNKTETVISKGCTMDAMCSRYCDPQLFADYHVISCNVSCCNTTFCNDFRLPTTPTIATTIITTAPLTTANATGKPETATTSNGKQLLTASVVSVVIAMFMVLSLFLAM